jgi:pescadillo protein
LKYISRSKAIRKLQLELQQFRKLCILKGVYPVQPKAKLTKSTLLTTYYYRKDIAFLIHDPILRVLRKQKVYKRKLSKAIAKKEFTVAQLLTEEKPVSIINKRNTPFIMLSRNVILLSLTLCVI